jgi:hypothetical protein
MQHAATGTGLMRIDKLAFLIRYGFNCMEVSVCLRSRPETEAGEILGFVASPVKVETIHKKSKFLPSRGVKKLVFFKIFFWSDIGGFFLWFLNKKLQSHGQVVKNLKHSLYFKTPPTCLSKYFFAVCLVIVTSAYLTIFIVSLEVC